MRKQTIYLVSFVLAVGIASTAFADIVDHWAFNEGSGTTARNSVGSNDGTINGATWVNDPDRGWVLSFDGTDDVVNVIGYNGITGGAPRTTCLWIKTDGSGTGANGRGLIAWGTNAGGQRWELVINKQDSGGRTVDALRWNASGGGRNTTGTTVITDSTWHHVAVTLGEPPQAINVKLYIDGVEETILNPALGTQTLNTGTDFEVRIGDGVGSDNDFFAGLISDVRIYDHALSQEEILELMSDVRVASNPNPADEATDVPREVVLSWKPGEYAAPTNGHQVYFGESFNDVNDASGAIAQSGTSYTPPQRLDFGKTYYWRVDEVNAPPDSTIFKGNVWSFTVEPVGYPVSTDRITITASSQANPNQGPEKVNDGSGLNEDGNHSQQLSDMWLSGDSEPGQAWIQLDLDQIEKVSGMRVWNHNTALESVVGYGIREALIEYSTDGIAWSEFGVLEIAQAPGSADYQGVEISLGGIAARSVRITAKSNWSPFGLKQYGLSEVRFLSIPVFATEPSPEPGAKDVDVDVTLSFKAGREAAKHDVYLGTDEQAVIDGTAPVMTVVEASYAASLDLASTYYWRVDEVNDAETPATWHGDIWSFSTREYLVVDDFESYNDIPDGEEGSNLVYATWVDGYENPSVNGSTIGYNIPFQPTMETSFVYDGEQSVPFFYNNTLASYSEVTANVANLQAGQDWSEHGIKALTLRLYGDPNNSVTDQMYVKINGSKIAYDADAENLKRMGWNMWYIDLASLGVNLSNIAELAIGFDRTGAIGGQGMVLLDSIRLYSYDRQVITPAEPDTTNLAAHWKLDESSGITASDSSGNNHHGELYGDPTWVTGIIGGALAFDGIDDRVEMPSTSAAQGFPAFDGEVTWVFWLKTGSGTGGGPVIAQGPVGAAHVQGNRSITVESSGVVMLRAHSVAALGAFNSNMRVDDNEWNHVAMTINFETNGDNDTVKFYVDGDLNLGYETDTVNVNQYSNVANDFVVTLGARGGFYNGLLDDVAVYSRVLSQEEIAWLAGRTPFDKSF